MRPYVSAGPGEGSVAALSTARSISSIVMSGIMRTRTTPVELPRSDMAVADAAVARELRCRARYPAPVLAPLKPHRHGKAAVPVGSVRHRDRLGRDEVEIFRVG